MQQSMRFIFYFISVLLQPLLSCMKKSKPTTRRRPTAVAELSGPLQGAPAEELHT